MTVASIDIGTNTVILLIAEADLSSFKIRTLENHQRIPRIGRGLKPGNPITAGNLQKLYEIISDYERIIKKYSCEKVLVTGTNPLRIASNRDEIIEELSRRSGYQLNVVTGDEEAEYSYLGAINDYTEGSNLLVIDIGGGSTEIIYGKQTSIVYKKSFPVGAVSGKEDYFISDPPDRVQIGNFINHVQGMIKGASSAVENIDTGIAIAGTPTTLACIKKNLKVYNEDLIEGSVLTKDDLNKFISELSRLTSAEIKTIFSSVVEGREDVILAGTILLNEIISLFKLNEIRVSTKGIRYGSVIKWMNSLRS